MRLKRFSPLLMLILLAVPAFSAEPPRYLEITFLSTNDTHGRIWPFDAAANPGRALPAMPSVAGVARRATIVRQIRAQSTTPVILTDQGDVRGWTALSTAFNGEVDYDVMSRMGYDAMVPGNHEFELPTADFMRNVHSSNFPWVCANLVYKETGKYVTVPYVIRDVWGVRVALFGLTNDLPNKQPEYYKGGVETGVFMQPPIDVAARLVPELRQQADIVVLLSHLGYREDVKLAQAVPGVDAIFGGHSHSVILMPTMVKVRERTAFDLGAVPVEQAYYNGVFLGKTRMVFRRDPESGRYTLMSCRGELAKIDASIPDDPEISGVIRKWEKVRQERVKKAEAARKPAQ